jgi:hypothetical protein
MATKSDEAELWDLTAFFVLQCDFSGIVLLE